MKSSPNRCLVCKETLRSQGPRYELLTLLELWKPVAFSEKTVAEHMAQSSFTQLYRCNKCRLGVFLPQIIGTPRFYIEAYNLDGAQAESDFTYSARKWDFVEGLSGLRAGNRILEVGCGPGHFLRLAAEAGCSVVGVEFNDAAAQAARHLGFRVHATLEHALAAGEQFDWVFAFHVLEHVADPIAFLGLLRRLMKPNGRIGIAVPNQDGPVRFIEPCVQDMPPHHATRWSRTTFRHAAQRVDLSIVRVAREPLTEENAYYYTTYGPQWLFPRHGDRASIVRGLAARGFRMVVKASLTLARLLGGTSSPLIPGQAMYIVLGRR